MKELQYLPVVTYFVATVYKDGKKGTKHVQFVE